MTVRETKCSGSGAAKPSGQAEFAQCLYTATVLATTMSQKNNGHFCPCLFSRENTILCFIRHLKWPKIIKFYARIHAVPPDNTTYNSQTKKSQLTTKAPKNRHHYRHRSQPEFTPPFGLKCETYLLITTFPNLFRVKHKNPSKQSVTAYL